MVFVGGWLVWGLLGVWWAVGVCFWGVVRWSSVGWLLVGWLVVIEKMLWMVVSGCCCRVLCGRLTG